MNQIDYVFYDTYFRQKKFLPKGIDKLLSRLIKEVIKSPKKGVGHPHKLKDVSKGYPFDIWSRDIPSTSSEFIKMLNDVAYDRGKFRLVYELHKNDLGKIIKIAFTNCGDHMYHHFCYYKSSRSKTKDYYKMFSDEENINI